MVTTRKASNKRLSNGQFSSCSQNFKHAYYIKGSDLCFPECIARVPVSLGGLGVGLCSPKVAFAVATVSNRSHPSATVRNRLRECRKALHSARCRRTVSRKCVRFPRDFAVILAFAEGESV